MTLEDLKSDLVVVRWTMPDGRKAVRFETPKTYARRVGVDFLDNRPEDEARLDAAHLLKLEMA